MSSSNDSLLQRHNRRRSSTSYGVDDEDRAHFQRNRTRRASFSAPPLRSQRLIVYLLIGIAFLLLLVLLSGRREKSVDWSQYAYSLYATDVQTLCNAYMVFEALKRYGSKADRVLHYPREWDLIVESSTDRTSDLLVRMRDKLKVKLLPGELIGANGPIEPGTLDEEEDWDASITKLTAFRLTTYKRLLHLDTDITLLQHLDELFLLPSTPVAMPRAYWSDVPSTGWDGIKAYPLTSLMVLLEPSKKDFRRMMETLQMWQKAPDFAQNKKYDMDLLNHRFGSSAMVLPHRPYSLLTSEFRKEEHSVYLGEPKGGAYWDPDAVLKEAKLVHFSDWPLPKPWHMWPPDALMEMQPSCGGRFECRERKIWKDLYDDFRHRRRDLCKILSVPPTTWSEWKAAHGIVNVTGTASAADSMEEQL